MRSAIVDYKTNVVENIIVSESLDPCPFEGFYMIGLGEDEPCNIGWIYKKETKEFMNPDEHLKINSFVLSEPNWMA